ncbi:class III signal peptide-containing protein [Methanococcus voltae]|uniref:Uncharacterized protein (UPF0333 family) n=2 Tax=Methanococcus voltae TaxID=2188 RepID=A0A8J7RM01_METVO|nr:class III signal peptide-containing protein [Methanococcus voltae]MBP2171771.1 uncharacterized protein (UPF0333 family) [Methanococcus voltae]MBP2201291.1 uncharacterized protein (UPF0333 family) [Methanococcus voltae]MCS3922767.1 uncharacterized protein (UPF0333 family) [Methanococcus voltae PS]
MKRGQISLEIIVLVVVAIAVASIAGYTYVSGVKESMAPINSTKFVDGFFNQTEDLISTNNTNDTIDNPVNNTNDTNTGGDTPTPPTNNTNNTNNTPEIPSGTYTGELWMGFCKIYDSSNPVDSKFRAVDSNGIEYTVIEGNVISSDGRVVSNDIDTILPNIVEFTAEPIPTLFYVVSVDLWPVSSRYMDDRFVATSTTGSGYLHISNFGTGRLYVQANPYEYHSTIKFYE